MSWWRLSGEFSTGMLIFSFRTLLCREMTGRSVSTFWAFLSYFSPTVWNLRRWHCQVVLHFVDWSFFSRSGSVFIFSCHFYTLFRSIFSKVIRIRFSLVFSLSRNFVLSSFFLFSSDFCLFRFCCLCLSFAVYFISEFTSNFTLIGLLAIFVIKKNPFKCFCYDFCLTGWSEVSYGFLCIF